MPKKRSNVPMMPRMRPIYKSGGHRCEGLVVILCDQVTPPETKNWYLSGDIDDPNANDAYFLIDINQEGHMITKDGEDFWSCRYDKAKDRLRPVFDKDDFDGDDSGVINAADILMAQKLIKEFSESSTRKINDD